MHGPCARGGVINIQRINADEYRTCVAQEFRVRGDEGMPQVAQ